MKKFSLILIFIIIVGVGFLYFQTQRNTTSAPKALTSSTSKNEINSPADIPLTTVLAENFDTLWSIAFLPDKSMLITERAGTVRLLDTAGNLTLISSLENVLEVGEGGLLGVTLHPDFLTNSFVYFYYTYNGSGNNTLNRVVRMTYKDKKLSNEKIIVDAIPGAPNHNGGRIKFGPDNLLYITTGDAQEPSQAQDKNSLAGKILRVSDEGIAAPGNPFNNRTYSYGHRNPQGIAWDSNRQLWQTEHGPSGLETGNDELNKISPGKNYGWPTIRGTQTQSGLETPIIESGTGTAWAPASLAFVNDKLYFSGLRGQALYEYNLSSKELKTFFKGKFGRIREVITGPDNMLYITTSNRDGRGLPKDSDDKIIRVNPQKLQ